MSIESILVVAGSIFGIVGFVIALQRLIQLICGRPKIDLFFMRQDDILQCGLYNLPIRSSFLKRLGIKKMPIQDLNVGLVIMDSEEKAYALWEDRKLCFAGNLSTRITLPVSSDGATFDVVKVKRCKVTPCVEDQDKVKKLDKGICTAHVFMYVNGDQVYKTQDFIVSDKYLYANWMKDID